ncbi:hypothetical protein AB1Y20_016490 [Prymnesium parvum]|uniref:SPX domain-containing protein n=1 Tax=Prymnesium parvum TaxID=97485 RepID=A0AB34IAS0_PRYPA
MVNFTEKLEANTRAEWASHYVDYRLLKKAMKKATAADLPSLKEPLLAADAPHQLFVSALHGERDKVQRFYEAELQRLAERQRVLVDQMDGGPARPPQKSSLTKAAIDLYRTLTHLRNFSILNYTGLLKAAKKFDKTAGAALLQREKAELDKLSFVQGKEVEALLASLADAYAQAFCEGSVQVAHSTLLVRKERPASWPLFSLGLRAGFALSLALWIAWDTLVDPRVLRLRQGHAAVWGWAHTQLPVYRCCFIAVGCIYSWAGCLYIWNKYRVNIYFMFDLDDKRAPSAIDCASMATRLAIICLLSLLLLNKAILGELPAQVCPGIFPAFLFPIVIGSLLFPSSRCVAFLRCICRVLFAPFFPVTFWDSFVADVLTSLAKPMIDCAYSACYVFTLEWRRPPRIDSPDACLNSWLLQQVLTPVLCALPLWCRFLQCLRVYHDSRKRVPALPNALKYAFSLLVVLFGTLHKSVVTSFSAETAWIQAAWLLSYLSSTLYTFAWDVHMDWRLHQLSRCGLRERIMFRRPAFYYFAVVADFILRFGWTATVVPHDQFQSGSAWFDFEARVVIPLVSVAELCRNDTRSMWAVLRLESEHLHNTEGFRRVDVIPLHFDHRADQEEPTEPEERKSSVVLELVAYAAVVVLLAAMSFYIKPNASIDGPHGGWNLSSAGNLSAERGGHSPLEQW